MAKFPVDPPLRRVLASFKEMGFRVVREGNHISMVRENADGTKTPLTIPNHTTLKGSTVRTVLTQSGIDREAFLEVYEKN